MSREKKVEGRKRNRGKEGAVGGLEEKGSKVIGQFKTLIVHLSYQETSCN